MDAEKIDLSVVVSVYNEEQGIADFYNVLSTELSKLSCNYEILFVNDGSADGTLDLLRGFASADKTVRVINFSRNYGHESAMIAGIDYSKGDSIICMDSDLQHPPQKIAEMLRMKDNGFDIISMVRAERKDVGALHKMNSRLFYRLANSVSSVKLPENASDFFLISRPVADVLKTDFRERTRFLRGIIQMVGFSHTTLEYVAPERIAGKSKYSFWKLMKLSFSAISSLSNIPLRISLLMGILFGILSLVLIIYSIVMRFMETPVSGYTTLIVFLCAFACILFFVLGIIGMYIGYIFDEVKQRPVYIVKEIIEE